MVSFQHVFGHTEWLMLFWCAPALGSKGNALKDYQQNWYQIIIIIILNIVNSLLTEEREIDPMQYCAQVL